MRNRVLWLLLFFFTLPLYSQTPTPLPSNTSPLPNVDKSSTTSPPSPVCSLIYDENQHQILPKSGMVVLYFFDPRDTQSIKMKDLVEKLPFSDLKSSCFSINISLSMGLKKTYEISQTPALVVLQDKKIIYGMVGFTDENDVLLELLKQGIKDNSIATPKTEDEKTL